MSLKVLRKGVAHTSDLIDDKVYRRAPIYVDTFNGSSGNDGSSWDKAVDTMSRALTLVETGGVIYFIGKIAEQLTGSNLKFDISIIGVGSLHHADQPGSGSDLYHYGSSAWVAPASPASATPLLTVRGRGWKFENIMFDAPADAACVMLESNSGEGTAEYSAGHAEFEKCEFRNGLYGIQDKGGAFNVRVHNCTFETLDGTTSGCGIVYTNAVNAPRKWMIEDCFFQSDCNVEGNERHIVSQLQGSLIKNNVFGTVKSTGKYIDLTNGAGNIVTGNLLGGDYTTDDYVAGTGDIWYGNRCAVTATTAPDGVSLVVPAAAG